VAHIFENRVNDLVNNQFHVEEEDVLKALKSISLCISLIC